MMFLFHTSPNEEIAPHKNGRFDEFLFFSTNVYETTAGKAHVFSAQVDSYRIIDAGLLWYGDNWEQALGVIREVMALVNVDEDTAMQLLDESLSIHDLDNIDPCDAGELSWDVQRLTAKAAKALGYVGVCVTDEQGSAYMLDATAIQLVKED